METVSQSLNLSGEVFHAVVWWSGAGHCPVVEELSSGYEVVQFRVGALRGREGIRGENPLRRKGRG